MKVSQLLERGVSLILNGWGARVKPWRGAAQMSAPGSSSTLNSCSSRARVSCGSARPSCSPIHRRRPSWKGWSCVSGRSVPVSGSRNLSGLKARGSGPQVAGAVLVAHCSGTTIVPGASTQSPT